MRSKVKKQGSRKQGVMRDMREIREMREQGAGGKFLCSALFPLPLCLFPMPPAPCVL
jgi:hypothetical protein